MKPADMVGSWLQSVFINKVPDPLLTLLFAAEINN